jgi:hypothetical protein
MYVNVPLKPFCTIKNTAIKKIKNQIQRKNIIKPQQKNA